MKTNKTIQPKASFCPIADAGIQPGLRKKKSRASGLPSLLSNQGSSGKFQSRCAASIGAFLEKRMDQLITLLASVYGHRQSARREPSFSKMELAGQLWSFKKKRKLKKEAKEESQASDSNPSSSAGEPSRQQKHPVLSYIPSKGSWHAEGYQHKISVKILQKNGHKDRNRPFESIVSHRKGTRPHLIARGYPNRTRTDPHTRWKAEDLRCEELSKGYQNPIRSNRLLIPYQQGTPTNPNPNGSQDRTRLHKLPFSYQVKMQSHSPPGCLSISKTRHTHPLFSPSQSGTTNSLNTIKS